MENSWLPASQHDRHMTYGGFSWDFPHRTIQGIQGEPPSSCTTGMSQHRAKSLRGSQGPGHTSPNDQHEKRPGWSGWSGWRLQDPIPSPSSQLKPLCLLCYLPIFCGGLSLCLSDLVSAELAGDITIPSCEGL